MSSKLKRTLTLLLALVMVALLLAGCGGGGGEASSAAAPASEAATEAPSEAAGEDAAEPAAGDKPYDGVKLNVILESHGAVDGAMSAIDEFTEATGIEVTVENFAYEEMIQKIILNFTSGSDQYDVVMNDTYQTDTYRAGDYIYDLNEFYSDPALATYFDESDFIPAYLETCKRDGGLYSLPVYGESLFLMYRTDLFEEYGLEVPETMEDMVAAAKTIYEGTGGETAGITLRGAPGIQIIYIWSSFLWGAGGRWFDDDGKMDLATPEAYAAIETFRDLLTEYGPMGYANFGWEENRLLFQSGKAAMTIDATVNGAYCEDPDASEVVGKVGYAPVPAFAGATLQGGNHSLATHGVFVSKFSKNPEAAALFASWLTSKQTQITAFQNSPHCGVTSQGAIDSAEFQEKYGMFADGMMAAAEQGNTAYYPQNEYAQEIITRVGTALSEVLAGSKTPEEALNQVNEEVNTEVIK